MIKQLILNILKNINRRTNPVDWKNLRSTTPVSEVFGYDRGAQSIHRYYIDNYVAAHADKIQGAVLEVGDNMYTERFKSKVTDSNIIHYSEARKPQAFVGDLTQKATLPGAKYDCFICTQTFNFIYDFKEAIHGARYVLKDGGYLIATVSGIQQISKFDESRWGDYWRFTSEACVRSFSEVFGKDNVTVVSFGNVLSCIGAMEGLASSELTPAELDVKDASYPLIIGILCRKN